MIQGTARLIDGADDPAYLLEVLSPSGGAAIPWSVPSRSTCSPKALEGCVRSIRSQEHGCDRRRDASRVGITGSLRARTDLGPWHVSRERCPQINRVDSQIDPD